MRKTLGALLLVAAVTTLGAAPAAAGNDEPTPRFEDAICPGVAGLKTETAELMVGRIRQNAQALGRELAPTDTCEPNLIVAFVDNGQAEMQQMDRSQTYAFLEMSVAERKALLADTGPVHVLSRVFTRTRDGMPFYRRESLTELPQATMWMAHSKIYSASRRDIVHALVLLDKRAVRGMSVDQLADYATMRALVHEPPTAMQAGTDSILMLFEAPAGVRPASLTAFDRALLGGLYEGIPNLPGNVRQATIAKATGREVPVE